MTNAARATLVPNFNVEQFAKEAARLTVIPPSCERPVWKWLNETAVPTRILPAPQTSIHDLGHRAAFVLLHVDGVSSLREIVKNTGIPREDALGIFAVMIDRGFISLTDDGTADPSPSGIRELVPRASIPVEALDEASWDSLALGE